MNGFQTPDPCGSGPTLRQALENAWVTLPCAYAGHTACWSDQWSHDPVHPEACIVVKPTKGSPSRSWSAGLSVHRRKVSAYIRKLYKGAMAYV